MRHMLQWNGLAAAQMALLLLLAGALQAADVPQTTERQAPTVKPALASSVNKAIDEWVASTEVTVSPKARGAIATQLSGFANKGISEASTPFLAKAYLYDLRDSKDVPGARPINLDISDIERYPLNRFVKAALNKKIGYLKCSSDPVGGKITIDGKARGNTVKEFVLSTGKHTVVIALQQQRCEEEVMIEEEWPIESRCPKK